MQLSIILVVSTITNSWHPFFFFYVQLRYADGGFLVAAIFIDALASRNGVQLANDEECIAALGAPVAAAVDAAVHAVGNDDGMRK